MCQTMDRIGVATRQEEDEVQLQKLDSQPYGIIIMNYPVLLILYIEYFVIITFNTRFGS